MDNTENNFANNISAAAKKYLTMIYPVEDKLLEILEYYKKIFNNDLSC